MDQHNEHAAEIGKIEAPLSYLLDDGTRPVTETRDPTSRPWRSHAQRDYHAMEIRDGRPQAGNFSLDREGFEFVAHDTKVKDFYDAEEVRSVYYPEIEALIKAHTGATRVLIFDHTVRAGDEETQEAKKVREPVLAVHNDYTDWSGPQRVRDLLPADEAEALLKHRLCVIQVWRPINKPVRSSPLAICDAQSMVPADMVAADRKYPDRVGEIYQIKHNPDHRWYYFPNMRRDEALIFKCYDSETDGRARFTAHTAFDDPTTPADAPPRESIEIRALVFFAPDEGADA
jgi:hypothetical protein